MNAILFVPRSLETSDNWLNLNILKVMGQNDYIVATATSNPSPPCIVLLLERTW